MLEDELQVLAAACARPKTRRVVIGFALIAALLTANRADAQVSIPARECLADIQAVPAACPLAGIAIELPDLADTNPALNDLLTDQPDTAAGLVFQQAAGLSQSLNSLMGGISHNMAAQALDLGLADVKGAGPTGGALVNGPLIASTPGSELSMFTVSGVTKLSHDGYKSSSSIPGGNGRTPEFEEVDYGLTLGVRWDASNHFDLSKNTVTFGFIANYTHTEIDLGTNDALAKYFDKTGSADVDSWSVGSYGLVTDGRKYGLLTLTTTFGAPKTENAVLDSTAEYDTTGVAASALSGVLIPVGAATTLDLRGGFNFVSASAGDYADSVGLNYSDAELEEISGTVSARLFSVIKLEQGSFRPFIQSGLSQRLHYRNEVTVEGVKFSFDDADTTVFARAGIDFEIDRSMQAYVAVRGDANEAMEAIAAQVGLTFKLD